MDSNFQVKISADISDLTSRLKAVEAELQKFSKAADGAAGAVKNMEQNANRGRLVAFAFGQVIRDAGFFANSFSLGILAISNNIPILIDQIALSIKALQPFAGAISIASSVLTAALTIWAYSSQAVDKNRESLDDYVKSLDDVREAQLKGAISADGEIRTLELLRRAAQNETFAKRERLKAVKELQERFPDYYANLSAEAIMAGKDADAHTKLANAIRSVANARAYEELIKENRKIELASSEKLIDLQAEIVKQRAIIAKSKENVGSLQAAQERLAATNKIRETEAEIFRIDKERDKAKASRISLEKRVTAELEKQKSISVITGGFGDAPKQTKDASKALEALNKTTKENLELEADRFAVKLMGIKIAQDAREATDLEASSMQSLNDELQRGLYTLDPIYQKTIESNKALKIAQDDANESVTALVRTVGNDLVNSFMLMMETGRFSFESIGQALLGMIKRLVAAAAAAAVLSVILSKIFPNATNTSFKDIFRGISGINIGGGLGIASSPTVGAIATNGINTSINSSNAMSAGGGVLETRVSGNDLVILLDRASNNRNKYF